MLSRGQCARIIAVSLSNGSRLGAEKFREIFNHIIGRAREAELVSDRLRIIDATQLQAKADLSCLLQPPPGRPEQVATDTLYGLRWAALGGGFIY